MGSVILDFLTRGDILQAFVFIFGFTLLWGVYSFFRIIKASGGPTKQSKGHGLPFPPGPKPLPLMGNILDMPQTKPWETITKWGDKYGGVVYITALGQNIIFLNTVKAVNDLLEKRSAIYSDRPRFPMLVELMGHDFNFSLMPYGDEWRKHRRLFTSMFGPGSVHAFNTAQEYASRKLLGRLLDSPEDFEDHIRLHSGQLIMMATYGIEINSRQDRFITLAEEALKAISDAARPGIWLVDIFPILKRVPAWLPGAYYQKAARKWATDLSVIREAPYTIAKTNIANGKMPMATFVSSCLEKHGHELEDTIRDCAAIAYGGASDTSVSALTAFILAMAMNPDVQKKAQAELDAVVGSSRLPSFADRKDLPYVNAIMKETLRWHTTVPQGLPHALSEDDVYDGHYIPAGTIVIANTWGIMHDPILFPDPTVFKPERFLSSDENTKHTTIDPSKFAFGYGRRFCAGYHFADNTLYLTMAYILSTFNISPTKDKKGNLVPIALHPTTGAISHPDHFKCSITPRSDEAVSLIRQVNTQPL